MFIQLHIKLPQMSQLQRMSVFHRNDKESIVNTMDLFTFQRQALYFLHLFNYLTLYMLSNIQHLVTSGNDNI